MGRCLPPPAGLLFLSASQPALRRSSGADSGPGTGLFPRGVSASRDPSRRGRPEPEQPRERPAAVGRDSGRLSAHGGGSGDRTPEQRGPTGQ